MQDTFWHIQQEISEILAKPQLTTQDLQKVEHLRDMMLRSVA